MTSENKVLFLGNPILDISLEVDGEFLQKYGLTKGGYNYYDPVAHAGLYESVLSSGKCKAIPGGAAQNTARACHAVGGNTAYAGCIGANPGTKRPDEWAELMVSLMEGIETRYQLHFAVNTGRCGVCIFEKDRTMTTDLGAARLFSYEEAQKDERLMTLVEKEASIIFTTMFFADVCFAFVKQAAHNCSSGSGRKFCLGLSAEFMVEKIFDLLIEILPHTDVVFGNDAEWLTVGKRLGAENVDVATTDDQEVRILETMQNIRAQFSKPERPVTYVCTRGEKSTLCLVGGETTLRKYEVLPVDASEITDTNGCGDFFAGAFLARLSQGCDIKDCIAAGNVAASHCLRRSGPHLEPSDLTAELKLNALL